jgi:leucyl-tRNA synthetase
VQVNGKLRERVQLACGLPPEEVLGTVKALPRIAELVDGKTIVKEIVVPDKLVNIVVR